MSFVLCPLSYPRVAFEGQSGGNEVRTKDKGHRTKAEDFGPWTLDEDNSTLDFGGSALSACFGAFQFDKALALSVALSACFRSFQFDKAIASPFAR